MSWKATALVKDITKGISPAEKLLLFVLADYHNTVKKVCWPSLKVLAEESLMSERNASRLLDALVTKGILSRVVGMGRGNTTLYSFVDLDCKDDNLSPFNLVKDDTKDDTKGDKPRGPIRKEPVIEPVLEPVKHMRFVHPTQDEVVAYCRERNKGVDPEAWFDHYSANGWKVGKSGLPMRDWQAAIRTWERNGFSNGKGSSNGKQSSDDRLAAELSFFDR
jgi:hypothetical protein